MRPLVDVNEEIRSAVAGCTCGPGAACDACVLVEDDEPLLDAHDGEPAKRRRYNGIDVAKASEVDKRSTNGGMPMEAALVADLKAAAIRLRDAELAKQKAGKEYAEALDAFNRFVAPVKNGTP